MPAAGYKLQDDKMSPVTFPPFPSDMSGAHHSITRAIFHPRDLQLILKTKTLSLGSCPIKYAD